MTDEVRLEIADGIAEIEFYHPKGNSLPASLLDELTATISKAGSNGDVRVLKLKSRGKTFCAGASFDELLSLENSNEAIQFFGGFGRLIEAIKNCPKFVIVQVQGKAVGGGVGVIAACDYAIATPQAAIKLSELSIGFGPFVIAPAVIRKIGLPAFSTLTIDSKNWKSAEWASEKGLYNAIVESEEELHEHTQLLCTALAGYSPQAMEEIKQMLWEGFESIEETHRNRAILSGKMSQSEFTQQTLKAFKKG